jgi:hypothetical membrane protein
LRTDSVLSASPSDRRRTGILFNLGATIFLLLTTAAESIYPNFSLQTNAISDLAAIGASTTVIEETAIFVFSICWMIGAFYLFRKSGRGLLILNLIPGIGFFLAGASPENVNLVIHSLGTVAFPVGAVAAMLSYRLIRSPFRYLSIVLGTLSLVSTFIIFVGWRVVCGTCGYTAGLTQLGLGLGGWESMIIYPLVVWIIGFGNYLMTASN